MTSFTPDQNQAHRGDVPQKGTQRDQNTAPKNGELRTNLGTDDATVLDQKTIAQWARVRARLRAEFGETAYKSWLKPLTLETVAQNTAHLTVPTRFMKNWIETQYKDRLIALWSNENNNISDISISHAGSRQPKKTTTSEPLPAVQPNSYSFDHDKTPSAMEFSAPLDERFTFERFIVGKPNELAFAAASRIGDAEAVPFNPLFLFGGVGLGKTHLMHSIAWNIRQNHPEKKVIYLSAEKFMYQFIRALRYKDTMSFKEQFRSVDVLMVDDVQFIAGKENTQEEFFHTFNALVDQNRQVIISADKSPAELDGIEERMKSRLGWGLVAEIHSTTYELRLGILQSKAEQLNIVIPSKVLEFLAHKITSNIRELEGALNRLVAYSSLVGRDVSLETAQEVLHDLLRANDRRITIEEIQKRVAEHYSIKLSEMHSARRSRAIARPRQVAMYLAKKLTSRSLPEIGRKFGGRDHTTVMHAVRKIEELRQGDSGFSEDVDLLRRMLQN